MPYKDPEKRRAYIAEYFKKHRKDIARQKKEYLENHQEEIAAQQKEYYKNHREKKMAYSKEYHEKHRERMVACCREYYKNHKKEVVMQNKKYRENHRAEVAEWQKKRMSTPEGKIIATLRTRLRNALKGKLKAMPTLKLLECSIKHFRSHIKKQFKPGMNWDNHTKDGWHLDHIRPINSFDLLDPEQQKACFHYTNFQPLWWWENLTKHKKYKSEVMG